MFYGKKYWPDWTSDKIYEQYIKFLLWVRWIYEFLSFTKLNLNVAGLAHVGNSIVFYYPLFWPFYLQFTFWVNLARMTRLKIVDFMKYARHLVVSKFNCPGWCNTTLYILSWRDLNPGPLHTLIALYHSSTISLVIFGVFVKLMIKSIPGLRFFHLFLLNWA